MHTLRLSPVPGRLVWLALFVAAALFVALDLAPLALADGDETGSTNLEMWAFVVGALSLPVSAMLNRAVGSDTGRAVVAVAVAAAAGVGNAAFAGHLHFDDDLAGSILRAIVASIVAYHGGGFALAKAIDGKPSGKLDGRTMASRREVR